MKTMPCLDKFYKKLKKIVLTIFGDMLVSKYPMFLFYHPAVDKISGMQTAEIIGLLEDGDVIGRAYDSYIDGYFIPIGESKCSHTGIYFSGIVYHAVAEGVIATDIIEFLRCDRAVIMRPVVQKRTIEKARKIAMKHEQMNVPYDFEFDSDTPDAVFCHEFTRRCYPSLSIYKMRARNKLHVRGPETYVADSFYLNKTFKVIGEF